MHLNFVCHKGVLCWETFQQCVTAVKACMFASDFSIVCSLSQLLELGVDLSTCSGKLWRLSRLNLNGCWKLFFTVQSRNYLLFLAFSDDETAYFSPLKIKKIKK